MSYLLGVRRAVFITSILTIIGGICFVILYFYRSKSLDECVSGYKKESLNARDTSLFYIDTGKKCKTNIFILVLFWSFSLMASVRLYGEMQLTPFYERVKREGSISLRLNGKIIEQRKTAAGVSIILDDVFILTDEEKEAVSEKVIVYGAVCEYLMGQRIEALGEFSLQKEPTNPGEFNSYIYYRAKGIYGSLFCRQVVRVYGRYHPIWELARRIRVNLEKIYKKLFSEEEAAIVSAILLGDKSGLSEDIKSLYQDNGISHILAISGLHISFFGRNVYKRLRKWRISFFSSAFFSASFLLFYGCIAGFSHSTFRAIMMLFITFLADVIGRSYDLVSAVYFSAILILAREPFCFLDAGSLLSFGAVFGIGLIFPVLQAIFCDARGLEEKEQETEREGEEQEQSVKMKKESRHKLRRKYSKRQRKKQKKRKIFLKNLREKIQDLNDNHCFLKKRLEERLRIWEKRESLGERIKKSVKESLLISISIQIVTIPILLRFYYELPIYGIFLNLIILPLLSFLLPFAVLAGTLGSIRLSTGGIFAFGTSILLQIYKNLAKFCLKLPFSKWTVGNMAWSAIIFYIIGVASILFFLYSRINMSKTYIEKMRVFSKIVCCLFVIILSFFMFLFIQKKCSEMKVIMLDVGQGDGILMKLPDGTSCMIDGGSSSKDKLGTYILIPALKYYGMGQLDYVFVSHEDSDHVSGLRELLEKKYPIKNIILPYREKKEKEKNYMILLDLAKKNKVNVIFWKKGDSMKMKNFSLSCLHPKSWNQEGEPNADSMVLSLQYYHFRALFTGDLADGGEDALVEELKKSENPSYALLKVAHHGSKKSTFEPFLRLVKPRLSLISCSSTNRYGHPGEETLERLEEMESKILITKDVGAMEFRISKTGKIRRTIFGTFQTRQNKLY